MIDADLLDLPSLVMRAQEAAKRRDLAGARADFEAALARLEAGDPHVPVRAGLGWVLDQSGDTEAALVQYDAALAHQLDWAPADHVTLQALRGSVAGTLVKLGRHAEAFEFYRLMLQTASGPSRLRLLGQAADAARAAGLGEDAERHQGEMLEAMRANLPASAPMLAGSLTMFGMAAAKAERLRPAEAMLREAVSLVPNLGFATQALINVLSRVDKVAEARTIAVDHYREKSFWTNAQRGEKRATVLTLVSLNGNIPEQHLLARLGFAVIVWQIEFGPGHAGDLPAYDLVLTQVADADHGVAALERAVEFAGVCDKPILNNPATVLRTRRDQIAALLSGIEGLAIPGTARLPGEMSGEAAVEACRGLGLAMPLMLRVAGQHGGKGVALAADGEEMKQDWTALGEREGTYVTEFRDYASPDGFYRKYRVIFVDRQPLPYHLAISKHWLVHYYSADMTAHAWKLEEEMRFLQDMPAVLGERAMAALEEIGRRMDLDYCGIDFGLTSSGEVLLFEANATMLVHPEEPEGPLAGKNPYIDRILHAFDALVLRRMPPVPH